MKRTYALVAALMLRGSTGFAADCAELQAAVDAAETGLRGCLEIGLGECQEEQTARDEAAKALAECEPTHDPIPPDPVGSATPAPDETPEPAPMATPPPPPPPAGGRVAVIVEGVDDAERGALLLIAQAALQGAELVEAGAIRAARAFGGDAPLDAAGEQKLRADLNADRLIALHVKPAGTVRYVAMRIHDASGETHQRFAEASDTALGAEVERLIREAPPLAAPAPQPTPPPVAVAPTSEPPGSDPFEPPLPRFGPEPKAPPAPMTPYIDVNAFAGSKSLATSDWAPLAAHGAGGFMSTLGAGDWPVHIALDGYYSVASGMVSGVAVRATTWEASLGARRIFTLPAPMLRPHIGGGMAVIGVANTAAVGGEVEQASGSGIGFWAGAGALLRLPGSVNLGVQLRYSAATVDVNGNPVQAGGLHAGATLGFGFGAAAQ